MKAKIITYERLINTGNFSHEKISITLEVEDGDTVIEVLKSKEKLKDLDEQLIDLDLTEDDDLPF